MNEQAHSHWRQLAGIVLAATFAACGQCGTPPPTAELRIETVGLTEGQQLTVEQDADPATHGFQIDLAIRGVDAAGKAVDLSTATLEWRMEPDVEFNAPLQGTINAERATFARLTLPPRGIIMRFTVAEKGGPRTRQLLRKIVIVPETPSIAIDAPASGASVLADDDADPSTPGFQLRFALSSTAIAGATGTLSCTGVCGLPPANFTVGQDGKAIVDVTLTQDACELQSAECVAVAEHDAGSVSASPVQFTLDTVAPTVSISAPLSAVASTTFAVEAAVGAAEQDSSAQLEREGAAPLTATVQDGAVRFPAVSVPADGVYDFSLVVSDAGGNVTRAPCGWWSRPWSPRW